MSSLSSQPRLRAPRVAEIAVERARLTVVPRRTQRAPRVPFVTLVSLLLVVGIGGLLFFNTHMQQASFVATSMQERAEVLAAKQQSLQMELDRLRDPQRVAARAKRLGMVPAPAPAFLHLGDGSVLGNPTVAEADASMRITPLPTVKPKSLRPDPVILELPRRNAQADGRASAAQAPETGRNGSQERGEQGSRR